MLNPRELKEAREWIAECQWRDIDSEEDVEELSDEEITEGIAKHFDGGIESFKEICKEG
jgi:hypothetical protein